MAGPPLNPQALWQQAEQARLRGDARAAGRDFAALARLPDWRSPAELRLAQLANQNGQLRTATAHVLRAVDAQEPDAALLESICHGLVQLGELEAACRLLDAAALADCRDPAILASLGQLMLAQSLPERALGLLLRARQLGVAEATLDYRIGLCAHYLGDLELAGESLARALARDPALIPAYWARSKLRRATADRHHVDSLLRALAGLAHRPERFLLHYALFKELDELDDGAGAWPHLAEALRLQRAVTAYDEAAEMQLFARLQAFVAECPASDAVDGGAQPLMVLGQPRSGSSLLENLLSSHPAVTAAGELRDFVWQMRWSTDCPGGPHLDCALVEAARRIDWSTLGARYLEHTRWHADGHAYFIDKMPTHFLAVGFILRALPGARIVHTARDPMETCFSCLREPFAGAYPHANDLQEMARHHLRYQRLMAHWRARFGERVLEVDYADLVADPAAICERVWAHCGLPGADPATTLAGRERRVTTASAAQVREPVHTRSLGRWRRYANQLAPMQALLDAG